MRDAVFRLLATIDSQVDQGRDISHLLSADEAFIDGHVLKDDPAFVDTFGRILQASEATDASFLSPFVVSGTSFNEVGFRFQARRFLGDFFIYPSVLGVMRIYTFKDAANPYLWIVATNREIGIMDASYRVLARERFREVWALPVSLESPSFNTLMSKLEDICKSMVRTACVFEEDGDLPIADMSIAQAGQMSWKGSCLVPQNWSDETMAIFEPYLDLRLEDLSQIVGFVPKKGRLSFWKIRPHLFWNRDVGIIDRTSNIRVLYFPDIDLLNARIVKNSDGKCIPIRLQPQRLLPSPWDGYNRLAETGAEMRMLSDMVDDLNRTPRPNKHGASMKGNDVDGWMMLEAVKKVFPGVDTFPALTAPWMGGLIQGWDWKSSEEALGSTNVVPLLVDNAGSATWIQVFVDRAAAVDGDFSRLYYRCDIFS